MFHTPKQHKEEAGGLFLKVGSMSIKKDFLLGSRRMRTYELDLKMNSSPSATGGLKYLSLLVKHLILVAIISCELKAFNSVIKYLYYSFKLNCI